MKRILLVDDDPAIVQMVRTKLERSGFHVVTASSGYEALQMIQRHGLPHLAVVDVMMPGMSGFELCRKFQEFTDLPIIMLTAVGEESSIVRGLEEYAEDYITKPFSLRELIARINRVLRRFGDSELVVDTITEIDEWLAVDLPKQSAIVRGEIVQLTPTENKLLYILMRNAGHTVTVNSLLQRLWPNNEVFEDSLRVHIHRLRQKIEIDPGSPRYVLTRRGQGYSFCV